MLVAACATTPAVGRSEAPGAEGTERGLGDPAADAEAPRRPATWAARLDRPGLPNLHRVNDGYYRGAQPSAEGMAELSRLGIKTVINLRAVTSDRSKLGTLPLGYEHISFKAWHAEDEDVVRFLKLATDPEKQPIFVHCQHGADRTGTMTAVYRIVVQGWSKDEAIAEMTGGGFGFHAIWKNLITYVRELDVEKIRSAAGLPPANPRGPGRRQ